MITVLADENIAHLDAYLAHHDIRVIKLAGRQIDAQSIQAHQAQALFIRSVTPINAATLADSVAQLRFIGSATIGTDHVDQAFLNAHNVRFANAAGCSKHSVAQYVISAILHTYPQYRHQKIRLGIIGLGNIGSTLAQYAQQLGWQVLGYDPFLAPSDTNNTSFDELLMRSDVVSIHTPLTTTGKHPTANLFNSQTFGKLNPNALLINSARGEIIDETALLEDIISTQRRVVLDVFPHEPTISERLLTALHLATPHIAGYTLEGKLRGTDMIYRAFCQHFQLPIRQTLETLLPDNPLSLQALLQQWQDDGSALKAYYDIAADDTKLRQANQQGVSAPAFDALRKHYPLRREWLFS